MRVINLARVIKWKCGARQQVGLGLRFLALHLLLSSTETPQRPAHIPWSNPTIQSNQSIPIRSNSGISSTIYIYIIFNTPSFDHPSVDPPLYLSFLTTWKIRFEHLLFLGCLFFYYNKFRWFGFSFFSPYFLPTFFLPLLLFKKKYDTTREFSFLTLSACRGLCVISGCR